MISYYDLVELINIKKQPDKILVPVDKNRELLFEFDYKHNNYYAVKTSASESFYQEYDSNLFFNITEDKIFLNNIKVISPYLFKIGEYISYYDLLTSIKLQTAPYKVRIHINNDYNDYIYDSIDPSEPKKYIEEKVDDLVPSWEFELLHQVSDWHLKNIEVIEAGNSLIRILEGGQSGSYFHIFPIKIKDLNDDTDNASNVTEMQEEVIAIEESDVEAFLYPVLKKCFNPELVENKKRYDMDNEFSWHLTYNYFSFDDIKKLINEIEEIISLLKSDYDNPKLDEIKKNYNLILYLDSRIDYRKIQAKEKCNKLIKNYINEIINFYKRFIDYLERMMMISKEYEYNLITFIGP